MSINYKSRTLFYIFCFMLLLGAAGNTQVHAGIGIPPIGGALCDDGDPCTTDLAIPGSCTALCSDAISCCTYTCQNNPLPFCQDPGPGPTECTPNTICALPGGLITGICNQDGVCETLGGIDPPSCIDGALCLVLGSPGICVEGVCEVGGVTPTECDDGNPCTRDRAGIPPGCVDCGVGVLPGQACCSNGCLFDPVFFDGQPCPFGADGCAPGGICDMGECVVEIDGIDVPCDIATSCDDGNPCTTDEYDPIAEQCVNTDRNVDPIPGETCTGQICDPSTGFVQLTRDDSVCNDNNSCNGEESCDGLGQCQSGAPLVCSDGNLCNGVETCDIATGCIGGTPLVCNDNNICNGTETCDPANGCQPGAALVCDDGNICNGAETCDIATGCIDGTPLVCDDGNVCDGTETCDPANGCQEGPPLVCDDGNPCNGTETCDVATGCIDGTPLIQDDGRECTKESCDPATGAISVFADSGFCDDGLFCNGQEACLGLSGDPVTGCGLGSISVPIDTFACTDRRCDEDADQYVFDPNDSKCDNGVFCDGQEKCDPFEVGADDDGCLVDPDPPVGQSCGDDGSKVCSEELMCVDPTGTIKIVKMADPNDGEDFLFLCVDENNNPCQDNGGNDEGPFLFFLDDEEEDTDLVPNMLTLSGLDPGTYAVAENPPNGWELVDVVCESNIDEEIVVENLFPILEVDAAEQITCTFFNVFLCGNGEVDEGEDCDPALDAEFCGLDCKLLDDDLDGVSNEFDLCPQTPEGEIVDETGCSLEEVGNCDCNDPNAIVDGFTSRGRTYIYGTYGDDIICGTSGRDVIFSYRGNDCIDSGDERDLIFAGRGNDLIFSGPGNDRIFAGPGDDEADGGDDFDVIYGGSGIDICFGESLFGCE